MRRDCSGFITAGRLIFVLVLFGGYTAFKFAPVSLRTSQVERAVDAVLEGASRELPDSAIRALVLKRANALSLPLDEQSIEVERETAPGERIVHVSIDYPITVSYLGSDRTFQRAIHRTRVYRVNEALEAQREEIRRQREEATQEGRERAHRRNENFREAWNECESKHGTGNCTSFTIPTDSDSDEVVKMY